MFGCCNTIFSIPRRPVINKSCWIKLPFLQSRPSSALVSGRIKTCTVSFSSPLNYKTITQINWNYAPDHTCTSITNTSRLPIRANSKFQPHSSVRPQTPNLLSPKIFFVLILLSLSLITELLSHSLPSPPCADTPYRHLPACLISCFSGSVLLSNFLPSSIFSILLSPTLSISSPIDFPFLLRTLVPCSFVMK